MESLYFLIPLSIAVLSVAVGVFWWAVKSGQYDDLDGEAERILFDDSEADPESQAGFKAPTVIQERPEREPASVNDA